VVLVEDVDNDVLDPVLLDDEDEEDELEELEIVDEEGEEDCWEVGVGSLGVEEEEDEGPKDGLGVLGGLVDETTEGDGSSCGSWDTLGMTELEVVELVGPFWRLCSQSRFSSAS